MILWILWNPFRNQLWTPRYSTSQRTQRTQRKPLMRSESLEALRPQDSPECTNHVCLLCLGRPKYSKNIVSSRGSIYWRGSFTLGRYAHIAKRVYFMSKTTTRETNTFQRSVHPSCHIIPELRFSIVKLKISTLSLRDIQVPYVRGGWGEDSILTRPNGSHRHVYPGVGRTWFMKRFQLSDDDKIIEGYSHCIRALTCNNKSRPTKCYNTWPVLITIRSYMEDRSND